MTVGVRWATPEQQKSYQQDQQLERMPSAVLMSVDNPSGWKLEELLRVLAAELEAKNARLASATEFATDDAGTLQMHTRTKVRELNEQIITNLRLAWHRQDEIQGLLSKLGPDEGPTGRPRV